MRIITHFSAALVLFFVACSGKQSTDNAQLDADISPVIPKLNGTVKKIFVADNQAVREGDTLLTLEDDAYKIALSQAEVALAIARQNVALAQSNRGVASGGVRSATANTSAVAANAASLQAGVEAARVRLALTRKTLDRSTNLLAEKTITQQQYDVAKADFDAAALQLKMAESQLASLTKQVDAARTQIGATQASERVVGNSVELAQLAVRQAQNAVDQARLQLSYCTIVAPGSGIVSKKVAQKGQVVSAGQPLMAVAATNAIWVVANFKETQVRRMKKGQAAKVEVDGYGEELTGQIESIAQTTGAKFSLLPPDNATGNFVKVTQRIPVKITLSVPREARQMLRAGMSASVTIETP